jgi:hypothetical protein
VFIFKEGLVRFCTAPYCKPTSKNLACTYMHLTNYAVNKHNAEAFVAPGSIGNSTSCTADSSSGDEAEGDPAPAQQQHRAGAGAAADGGESASKWSFSQLRQHLESQGGQDQQQRGSSTNHARTERPSSNQFAGTSRCLTCLLMERLQGLSTDVESLPQLKRLPLPSACAVLLQATPGLGCGRPSASWWSSHWQQLRHT